MKEVIDDIDQWLAAGETRIVLATVLATWGSAPRKVGAKMAFTAGGERISGSVSGGCVEGAVVDAGDEVLATGRPQHLRFGVADELAWGVGLACGGTIEIFVEPLNSDVYSNNRQWVEAASRGVVVTITDGPDEAIGTKLVIDQHGTATGSLGAALDEQIVAEAGKLSQSGLYPVSEGVVCFFDVLRPLPELVIIGGAHISVVLVQLARLMGYRTVVVDPRRAFGNEARFPNVDQLIQAWPDKALAAHRPGPQSAIVTLSHDPKIDDPGLQAALDSPAFYIGALGSRKTHARRCGRLAEMGYPAEQLARIHAPVGLDIGADNPEEIALAIMSQVVAAYRGRVTG